MTLRQRPLLPGPEISKQVLWIQDSKRQPFRGQCSNGLEPLTWLPWAHHVPREDSTEPQYTACTKSLVISRVWKLLPRIHSCLKSLLWPCVRVCVHLHEHVCTCMKRSEISLRHLSKLFFTCFLFLETWAFCLQLMDWAGW